MILDVGCQKADQWSGIQQSDSFRHSPKPSMYFGLCARSRGSPLIEPARSAARSKLEAVRLRARGRRAVSRLSRTITDFATRFALAARSSSARSSSEIFSEIVCIHPYGN